MKLLVPVVSLGVFALITWLATSAVQGWSFRLLGVLP